MNESTPPDRRRTERFIAEPGAWVAWKDPEKGSLHIRGRCLDLSTDGLCIELGQPLPIGVAVTVGVPIRHLQKQAIVRHCTTAGPYYAIGFEYIQPESGST